MTQDNLEKLYGTELLDVLDMENNITVYDAMIWSTSSLNDSFPTVDTQIITLRYRNCIVTS